MARRIRWVRSIPTPSAFGWGTGWTVGGIGWYRKRFALTDLAPSEQVEIRFDGAFMVTEAWLNGVALGRNVNGYLGFVFDLTPYLRADGANVLAVRVTNIGETARWYSGSGVYRHVWLNRTGAVRVPYSGSRSQRLTQANIQPKCWSVLKWRTTRRCAMPVTAGSRCEMPQVKWWPRRANR